MLLSKKMITKQHKEECMYHKQLIARLKNDPDYQQLTINKLNQILPQTGELSSEYLQRKTNEKVDGVNAPKCKVVPSFYENRSKVKHDKKKRLQLLIKALDYISTKFDIENELSNLLD